MNSTSVQFLIDIRFRHTVRAFMFCAIFCAFFCDSLQISAQPSQWNVRGVGGGGAMFLPSWSPHNPNELFIACDMSQLFRTTDLGKTWNMAHAQQVQTYNNRGHVQFTSNPSVIFTVDATSTDGSEYYHTKKSTDGGTTWSPLPSDPTSDETYSLFVDFQNPNRIIISNYNTLYASVNGGVSFTQKYSTPAASGLHLAGAFFDGTNIYVGTNLGVLRSTDSGATFGLMALTGIPASQAIVSFAGAKQGSTTRFFCVTVPAADVYAGMTALNTQNYQGVYSIDAGQSAWVAKISGIAAAARPYFVSMSPNNINVAYIGGGSTNSTPMIFKTSNAGATWTSILQTTNNQNVATGWSGHQGDRGWSYGEFVLGLAVSPTDPNRVVFTDLGFAHATIDGGTTWQQLYVDPSTQNAANAPTPQRKSYRSVGLENTTSWRVEWADANTMIGCYSDIQGIRSTDAGTTWSFDYTGHTDNTMYYCLRHPTSNLLYAATSNVHDMYQSTYLTDAKIDGGKGKILFSSDKGKIWQTLHDFQHPVFWLAADPNNPNRLYASVIHSSQGGIYVTNNLSAGAASQWTKLATPPRTEGHPFSIYVLKDGTLVCSFSGRRTSNFTASSGVFYSTDGGVTWLDRSDAGMQYWTKDLVIDPHDPTQNTWYAGVFSGWGGAANNKGGLYKTINRGQSWTKISSIGRVTSCAINPTVPGQAYMTTETDGLWFTNNINTASPQFTRMSAYSFRQPERVFFNPFQPTEIWVTSFGNGMKVANPAGPVVIPVTTVTAVYSGLVFPESVNNSGSISQTKTITLTNDTWATNLAIGSPLVAGVHYTALNVPNGLTIVVTKTSQTVVTVSFTGSATAHANNNDVQNVQISFLNAAISSQNVALAQGLNGQNLGIDFNDPTSATYSGTVFLEAPANNGSILQTQTITLNGTVWASNINTGAMLNVGTHFTMNNLPQGLTPIITKISSTQVTIAFSGVAQNHTNSNDVQNMQVVFLNAAVETGNVQAILGLNGQNLTIDFNDLPTATYSGSVFSEASLNNGTITQTRTITLQSAAWTSSIVTGATFNLSTHYTINNLPQGLTAFITKNSATQATISLTGTALNHANSNDVQNLQVLFLDAALASGNVSVVQGLNNQNLTIDFNDPPSATYSGTTFTESAANNGTILQTRTITLKGDTWVSATITGATFNLGAQYTVNNLPQGLTLVITKISSTQVTISLTGSAINHTNSNDVQNFQITFLYVMLASGNVSAVQGLNGQNLVIDFNDPATATYSGLVFPEASVNNGTIAQTRAIIVQGDTWASSIVTGATFNVGVFYTATNLPQGLTAVITKNSSTQASISFAGAATNHANSNDAPSVKISFLNSALASGNADAVQGLNGRSLFLDFNDPTTATTSVLSVSGLEGTVYPNPTQDIITLNLPLEHSSTEDISIRVWDVLGRVVMELHDVAAQVPVKQISLAHLSAGTYHVEARSFRKVYLSAMIVKMN